MRHGLFLSPHPAVNPPLTITWAKLAGLASSLADENGDASWTRHPLPGRAASRPRRSPFTPMTGRVGARPEVRQKKQGQA
jgi:hypothetical protein